MQTITNVLNKTLPNVINAKDNCLKQKSKKIQPQRKPIAKVLLVDDDHDVRLLYKTFLESHDYYVQVASDLRGMKHFLLIDNFDVVLLDLYLDNESGIDGIPFILEESPRTIVAMLTSRESIDNAVAAINKGASAFFLKSENPLLIIEKLENLVSMLEPGCAQLPFCNSQIPIIGQSEEILAVLRRIHIFKEVDSTVLVSGESGTGKELVARALHSTSARKDNRFAAINCGAIPECLLESELFGHKKGAFTDAKNDRKGAFEYCKDGTLLLDEISELPLALQVKLLRVLQEKEVTPVGQNIAIPTNVRVIAATNKDLKDEVRKGNFREDLFFRLNVLEIKIPSLRKRLSDIPLLVKHFVSEVSKKYNKKINPISKRTMTRLMAYHWPGNVRELQNMIERAAIMSQDGELHINDMFYQSSHPSDSDMISNIEEGLLGFTDGYPLPYLEAKQLFEKAYLKKILSVTGGNIAEAARISKQYRANLYRMIQKYNIDICNFKRGP